MRTHRGKSTHPIPATATRAEDCDNRFRNAFDDVDPALLGVEYGLIDCVGIQRKASKNAGRYEKDKRTESLHNCNPPLLHFSRRHGEWLLLNDTSLCQIEPVTHVIVAGFIVEANENLEIHHVSDIEFDSNRFVETGNNLV